MELESTVEEIAVLEVDRTIGVELESTVEEVAIADVDGTVDVIGVDVDDVVEVLDELVVKQRLATPATLLPPLLPMPEQH